MNVWENIPEIGNSQGKSPEKKACLVCLRNSREAELAGPESKEGARRWKITSRRQLR